MKGSVEVGRRVRPEAGARLLGVLAGLLGLVCLVSAWNVGEARAAGVPAPAWYVTLSGDPTAFPVEAGRIASYTAVAINEGGTATDGSFDFVLTLPDGVEVQGEPSGSYGAFGGTLQPLPCAAVSRTVTCEGIGVEVAPGESVVLSTVVSTVSAATGSPLLARASMQGGGSPGSSAQVENQRGPSARFGILPGGFYAVAAAADGQGPEQAGETPSELEIGSEFTTELQEEVELKEEAEFLPTGGGAARPLGHPARRSRGRSAGRRQLHRDRARNPV